MELDEAKEIIDQRYTQPTLDQVKKAFGVGVFNSGYDLTLLIDWKPIEKYLEDDNSAAYADVCMQLLQNITVWDGFKKGIIRYISEDKDQLQLFVNYVNSIFVTFSIDIDTDLSYKQRVLTYTINVSTQQFITSNVAYERLHDIFDELAESGEQAQDQFSASPSSVGGSNNVTPSTPLDDKKPSSSPQDEKLQHSSAKLVSNGSKDNLALDQNQVSQQQAQQQQQPNHHHQNSQDKNSPSPSTIVHHGSFRANNDKINTDFPPPAIIDPNDFAEDEILFSATQKNIEAVKQENNLLSTGRHIEDLKTICRQPRILVNGDLLGVKYMLRTKSDLFWKPSEADVKILQIAQKHAKKISNVMNMSTNFNEQLIKLWKITKVNVKGLLQERILILTTLRLYTAKMAKDKEIAQVDEKHFKHFDLINFVMVDVGRFKPTSNQKLQPFGLCLYIRDPNKSPPPTPTPVAAVAAAADGEEAPKKKKKKGIAAKIEKAVRKGSLAFSKRRDSVNGPEKGEQKRERPKTDDLNKAYFMAPSDVHISEYQQRFLNEVAWCVYAAALALKRSIKDCHEPFEEIQISRPESSVSAFLYNKLGLGKS